MDRDLSRRAFTISLPAVGLGMASLPMMAQAADSPAPATGAGLGGVPPLYPRHELAMVANVVGLSHRDLKGVQELVDARPALANAAHDWGFGDWETALGAASHTGRVEIAEYLLSKGARPDIFTLAMLGNLAAARAMIESMPGLQRTRGPHGISLMAHARAGGERAKEVVAYLNSLGDADEKLTDLPITDEVKAPLVGVYRFGPNDTDCFEVGEGMGALTIKRTGTSARRMLRLSATEFHPAGAPSVRIVFDVNGGAAARVTVTDHDTVVTGKRAG